MRHRPLCPVFLVLILFISVFWYCRIPLPGSLMLSEEEKENIEYRSMVYRSTGEKRITAERTVTVSGTVAERWKSGDGYCYILKDTSLSGAPISGNLHKVRINTTKEFIKTGTKIKARGKLAFTKRASNPGGFDSWTYYAGDDIYSMLRLKSCEVLSEKKGMNFSETAAVLRERVAQAFEDGMGEEYGGILSAMLLGDRSGIGDETRINYSVSGLGHLLAISGLHVGIIGAALLSLLKRTRLPKAAALGFSVGLLYLYCAFAGSRDSTLRAFVMFAVMAAARYLLRSYDMLSALSFAGIVLLLISPYRLFRTGFLLSFGAVAGLGTVYPLLKERTDPPALPEGAKQKCVSFLREGFLVWLGVTAVTLPVVLRNYSELPLYGAIANVLFVPMTEAVILLGIAGGIGSLILPGAAPFLLLIPKGLISLQNGAGAFFRKLPGAMIITGQPEALKIVLYYAGLVLILLYLTQKKPGKVGFALSLIMIGLIFVRPVRTFSVTALDVGQGDSVVVTTGNNTLLIDGGSSSVAQCGKYVLLPYLKNQGIACVDAVLVTHNDSDHMNGILEMLEMSADRLTIVRIKRLLMPVWMKEDSIGETLREAAGKAGCEVIYLSRGDQIRSDTVQIDILAPEKDGEYTGNEGSLVAGLEFEDFRALFTGDLEGKAEEELAEELGRYDYLKAAHHGSSGSTSEAFLLAVSPKLTVFSAPKLGMYNHPGRDTIERVEESGSRWLQTGTSGAIRVEYQDGRMLVKENNL